MYSRDHIHQLIPLSRSRDNWESLDSEDSRDHSPRPLPETTRSRGHAGDGGWKVCRETRNLGYKKLVDENRWLPIKFEVNNKGTMIHIGPNVTRWSNLVGELGSHSLDVLRDQHMESDLNHEYQSLIQTFFDTHTYDGVFAQDDARIKYEEMVRLRDLGANTPLGRPYIEEEIMTQVRGGKQRGYIPGVGKVLAEKGKTAIFSDLPRGTYSQEEIDEMLSSRDKTIDEGKEEAKRELELLRRVVMSDEQMSQRYRDMGSEYEIDEGSGSKSGGGEDEDAGGDEDADGDDDI
ncbi:hypothetical protein Tco_0966795 [Tanacetum coccineum]